MRHQSRQITKNFIQLTSWAPKQIREEDESPNKPHRWEVMGSLYTLYIASRTTTYLLATAPPPTITTAPKGGATVLLEPYTPLLGPGSDREGQADLPYQGAEAP